MTTSASAEARDETHGSRGGRARRKSSRPPATCLPENGYEQFTLRNVAERVGMRMSHLQYYFATKGDLVRAIAGECCG